MKKPIRLYWSSSKPNFGDALSPLICEAVSGRSIIYSKPRTADMVAIGSLLQRLKENWFQRPLTIWGTGFIADQEPKSSKHRYAALRGELSKSLVNNTDAVLGDPGLLSHLLLDKKPLTKSHKIGIVEHYKDMDNAMVSELINTTPHILRINIFSPPELILKQISSCEVIFSSAMHGLIAADSLHVPNKWIKLSNQLKGNDFKFHDYYSAFGMSLQSPLAVSSMVSLEQEVEEIMNTYSRPNIDEIQTSLLANFPQDF